MTASIDRTSPAEPRAMYKYAISSFVVPRSKPSAMLLEMEKGGSLDLICKVPFASKGRMSSPLEHNRSQISGKIPDRQLFKAIVFHGDVQSQISNL